MSNNESLMKPRPTASNLVGQGDHYRSADLSSRRAASNKNRLVRQFGALVAMGGIALVGWAAGGTRPLAHDISQAADDAVRAAGDRVAMIEDAFSGGHGVTGPEARLQQHIAEQRAKIAAEHTDAENRQ